MSWNLTGTDRLSGHIRVSEWAEVDHSTRTITFHDDDNNTFSQDLPFDAWEVIGFVPVRLIDPKWVEWRNIKERTLLVVVPRNYMDDAHRPSWVPSLEERCTRAVALGDPVMVACREFLYGPRSVAEDTRATVVLVARI